MNIVNGWRFRVAAVVLVLIGYAQIRNGHSSLAMVGLFALELLWAISLGEFRTTTRKLWVIAVMLATSALLVRLVSGASFALVITFGVCGAYLSWPWLMRLGLPLVLAGAWWQHYPLTAARLDVFVNSCVTLSIAILFGRFVRDGSERRRAEAAALADLRVAHEKLQAHAAEVAELATLRERSRLARELHDTLGHSLSAITVNLEAVRRLQRRDPAAAEPMLVETQAMARQAMQELRQYLADLREDGDRPGLAVQIEAIAREAALRNGWQLTLDLTKATAPAVASRALVQIAREALTNVERHAGASTVEIRLQQGPAALSLTVADNGRGFRPGWEPEGHFGLVGMRERLAEFGGELIIESKPGAGACITARLPGAGGNRAGMAESNLEA